MQSIPEAAAYIRRDDEENVTLLDEPEPDEEQLDIKAEKYIKQHNEKNLTELEEGDLVRIRHFLYDHWLVYIGNGEVIHFSSPDNKRGKKQRAKQFINNFSVFGAL
ncbi:uncharacterized protein LOC132757591 [Ruditapes philippinarum]|uniref:uncharacterized protein LOC132757591 n=1 Tax=Ruditapes philippinarum TaxID=129788 RepID=UPI00295C04BA|nr:uncharacterized protein LOC132757591 [Ruditapes philippinarum]